MRGFLRVLSAILVMLAAFGGCGPHQEVVEIQMHVFRARVEEVGTDYAVVVWETSSPGDTRVDYALTTEAATDNADVESVSDEQHVPLLRDGGVTVPDPRFDSVSNTVYHNDFTQWHEVRIERLLPGRTYVVTVSSSNYMGTEIREFGVPLMFTTSTE